jgi:hypothetical protein
MSRSFTRSALYELVWSEPMQSLARSFSLSDRGLAKICAAANIPVPARGYWAKLQAGKSVTPPGLPPRALGQPDLVFVGRDDYGRASDDADILNSPIPPPPAFTPDMSVVETQAAALVAKVPLPLRESHGWHSQIQKLIDADAERARKQAASAYPSSWDAPIFDSPFEKRRLRILNALFTGLTRCGMKPRLGGKEGRDTSVTVGSTHVSFALDSNAAAKLLERERQGYGFAARGAKDKMRLTVSRWWASEAAVPSWQDEPGVPLERRLREIAAALIVFAEQTLRDAALSSYAYRIQRKAELEEDRRKRQAEEERRRRERQARMEKARVDHLLAQAQALHQAGQIRDYVARIQALNAQAPDPMTPEELDSWSSWALAQADRIDPVVLGAYKNRPAEPVE